MRMHPLETFGMVGMVFGMILSWVPLFMSDPLVNLSYTALVLVMIGGPLMLMGQHIRHKREKQLLDQFIKEVADLGEKAKRLSDAAKGGEDGTRR